MWKRDEAVRPAPGRETQAPSTSDARAAQFDADLGKIGKSVFIRGELSGSEDLTIEGNVEGTIQLRDNVLTIGRNGRIHAQVSAKVVVIHGEVKGNVVASEKVDIRDNGSVEGDITAPRVAIAEGALFRGSVDMQRAARAGKADVTGQTAAAGDGKTPPKPAPKPPPVPQAPAQASRVG